MLHKFGKKEARPDHRIKRLSAASLDLPAPPMDSNWYAAIGDWPMCGNDEVGDCVEAAVLHLIQSFSTYAGSPLIPTTAEAVTFYEKAAGYNPTDPNTDQGSYVMGPGGVMEYWHNNGVMCGGQLNKPQAFLQITQKNPIEWQQGVSIFGGVLTGLQLPEAIVSGDEAPFVWENFDGPVAGGHEVLIVGYETLNSGRYYDLVSWGQLYRASEKFLLHCVDETVVVVDPVAINARGLNAADLSLASLTTNLSKLGA